MSRAKLLAAVRMQAIDFRTFLASWATNDEPCEHEELDHGYCEDCGEHLAGSPILGRRYE